MYDVIVIGAGVIGASVSYELCKYDCKVLTLEKENEVSQGTSLANSGIIHAGGDPEENTLKGEMGIQGARLFEQLCKDLFIHYNNCGGYIVATSEEEYENLKKIENRAIKRNIPFEWLSPDEAQKNEPNLSNEITHVLSFPTTAVVDPWEVTQALLETAVLNGVKLELNQEVKSIDYSNQMYTINTQNKIYQTKAIVNCAGTHADQIVKLIDKNYEHIIKPRRGVYFVLDNDVKPAVSRPIYPAPTKLGKGVLAIPTIHHNLLVGPNSLEIDNPDGVNTTSDELEYIKERVGKTVANIDYSKVIRSFAGVRASTAHKDFVIEELKGFNGFYNCLGIDSPGLSSAPAIAKRVVGWIQEKEGFTSKRKMLQRRKPIILKEMPQEERENLIQEDPRFAQMVCRCEHITEGEIVDAINRPVGARTIKGVKLRVRPGSGRCQGGFCEPRVVSILARELAIDETEVVYDRQNSRIFIEGEK